MSKKNTDKLKIKYNETILPEFVDICKLSQSDLKNHLKKELAELGYEEIISKDGYLYAKGEIPILLVAHMDTVHTAKLKSYFERTDSANQHVLNSPQGIGGDDRCGVYSILEIIKAKKCSVLFCEDEETGGRGVRKFVVGKHISDIKNMKYLIELDRAHSKDAVFYYCDNKEFTKFICENTGYKESYGSFSDISVLAPAAEVAAVNLSCGYYNAHLTTEYVVIEEMLNTIEVVKKLVDVECEQFKYIKKTYSYGNYGGYGGYYRNYYNNGYSHEEDEDDYDFYKTYRNKQNRSSARSFSGYRRYDDHNDYDQMIMYVVYSEDGVNETEVRISGSNKDELWRKFFHQYSDICMNQVQDYYFDYV